jgi:hypothetical protein
MRAHFDAHLFYAAGHDEVNTDLKLPLAAAEILQSQTHLHSFFNA